jgi:thiamine pyrophosphate-dependent acetolactate synthase large subunit-like protein
MTKDEKLALLAEWQAQIERSDEGMRPLTEALGSSGESKPELALYWLQEAYTRAVAMLVGDFGGSLSWYAAENDFGRKAMQAGTVKEMRAIASFEDLLWLLEVTA